MDVHVIVSVTACAFLMLVFQMWQFLSTMKLKAISHYVHHKILYFLVFLALCATQALALYIKMPNSLARLMSA